MTAPPVAHPAELGRARLRKEDARLITGQTNWTDNIVLPGLLYMAFLRSPHAHAKITRVNVAPARSQPGVIAAFSGADFEDEQGSLPCAWPVTPDIVIPNHPPMAVDEVRYVGEAVAVVIARDRYTAADAVEAIEVDYEPLPPVLDIRTALDEDSPKVHEAGNKSFVWPFGNGDIEAAFSGAPVVLVNGVSALAVYYGVKRNFGSTDYNVDTYETYDVLAAAGTDYANISSVRIVITFVNPVVGPSQPPTITLERVIQVMSRGGPYT